MTKILTKEDQQLRENLPHIFGWPWYDWAYKFFESTNRFNFLVAANQISKSSTQIRKCIDWATNQAKWKTLWDRRPQQFWYFYPSKIVATSEFYEKWEPEFLPRGKMKEHPQYGWEVETRGKEIWAIHFNSGVTVYFRSYEQDPINLQTSSVHAVFADEEAPFDIFHELRARLIATNGYFHMVFTATLGQEEWRRTMEPSNESEELFKDALKIQVSMYDCLKYKNGKKSPWTIERIKEVEHACATDAEVQRRVHGRFIVSSGRKFPSFGRGENLCKKKIIPLDWHIYTGVDIGSGGEKNHPAAIVMIAVQPDFKRAEVFRGWRGDGIVTTSGDIIEKHQDLLNYESRRLHPVIQSYDWQARDFFTIASRSGLAFTPAAKKRDSGENLLNTLFKLKMLFIHDDDPELSKLTVELSSLLMGTPKTAAHDDFCDALRYSIMPIPWDFDGMAGEIIKVEEQISDERSKEQVLWDTRSEKYRGPAEEEGQTAEEELAYWQDLLGN